jgi:hypothetical protein
MPARNTTLNVLTGVSLWASATCSLWGQDIQRELRDGQQFAEKIVSQATMSKSEDEPPPPGSLESKFGTQIYVSPAGPAFFPPAVVVENGFLYYDLGFLESGTTDYDFNTAIPVDDGSQSDVENKLSPYDCPIKAQVFVALMRKFNRYFGRTSDWEPTLARVEAVIKVEYQSIRLSTAVIQKLGDSQEDGEREDKLTDQLMDQLAEYDARILRTIMTQLDSLADNSQLTLKRYRRLAQAASPGPVAVSFVTNTEPTAVHYQTAFSYFRASLEIRALFPTVKPEQYVNDWRRVNLDSQELPLGELHVLAVWGTPDGEQNYVAATRNPVTVSQAGQQIYFNFDQRRPLERPPEFNPDDYKSEPGAPPAPPAPPAPSAPTSLEPPAANAPAPAPGA